VYTVQHFSITSDVSQLIATSAPWRQRENAFEEAFPQRENLILVVVQAPTPELTRQATNALAQRLSGQRDLIRAVRQPGSGNFFEQNALLFLPTEQVGRTLGQLSGARPLINTLSDDPSLRGVMKVVSYGAAGVRAERLQLNELTRPITMLADTI
jgi:hypothetical protein